MTYAEDLEAEMPSLRGFAMRLCGDPDRSHDLVQETLLKAWSNRKSFELGTSIRAWLFTIMRHTFYSDYRKRRREVQDPEGVHASKLQSLARQEDFLRLQDLAGAWGELPFEQQQALMLVGVDGISYEDAALVLGCAVGTVKSRTNRARRKLADILGEDLPKDALEAAWETMCASVSGDDVLPSILGGYDE